MTADTRTDDQRQRDYAAHAREEKSDQRLRDLETLVVAIGNGLARETKWMPTRDEAYLHAAIAARLAEPRTSTATDPVEFVPWKYADEPSEDDLRELAAATQGDGSGRVAAGDLARVNNVHPKNWLTCVWRRDALAAWRWCRERMVAAPPQPAPTVPASPAPLAQLIRRTFDEWMGSAETVEAWASRLERAIAARIPAPAVPAEIVERLPHPDKTSDENTYEEWNAIGDLLTWARSQPARAPAPDPEAVELAKRLPPADQLQWFIPEGDLKAFPHRKYRQSLADAAAFVRRAARESGA